MPKQNAGWIPPTRDGCMRGKTQPIGEQDHGTEHDEKNSGQ